MEMRTTPTVTILYDGDHSMVGEGAKRIIVSRTTRGRFTVRAHRPGEHGCRSPVVSVTGVGQPSALMDALDACAREFAEDLDWASVVRELASLDWATAAVIATGKEVAVPSLPSLDVLTQQRTLRRMGKVLIGVEWGYDPHDLRIPFETWLQILLGESYDDSTRYWYEGKRFTAVWSFDVAADDQLRVIYYDDADEFDFGEGWMGPLSGIDLITGPELEGVDLARAALAALLQTPRRTPPGSGPSRRRP